MTTYRYEHDTGYGAHHAEQGDDALHDRPIFPGQAAVPGQTMADLDLTPGTEVIIATDEDGGFIEHDGQLVVEWVDRFGNGRRTAISRDFMDDHFVRVED